MDLIPDSVLIKIPVNDKGEKLVDLRIECPDLVFDINDPEIDDRFYFARESIAKMLNEAQSNLEDGYKLVIFSAYRPMSIQTAHYEAMLKTVEKENPDWRDEKVKLETAKRIAPPDIIPPHTTGGAIDLSINENGKLLDMGTGYKEFNDKTQTYSKSIAKEQKQNRKILSKIMTEAGFVNYPTEWWHWSFGDRYWAAYKNKEFSIYHSADL